MVANRETLRFAAVGFSPCQRSSSLAKMLTCSTPSWPCPNRSSLAAIHWRPGQRGQTRSRRWFSSIWFCSANALSHALCLQSTGESPRTWVSVLVLSCPQLFLLYIPSEFQNPWMTTKSPRFLNGQCVPNKTGNQQSHDIIICYAAVPSWIHLVWDYVWTPGVEAQQQRHGAPPWSSSPKAVAWRRTWFPGDACRVPIWDPRWRLSQWQTCMRLPLCKYTHYVWYHYHYYNWLIIIVCALNCLHFHTSIPIIIES